MLTVFAPQRIFGGMTASQIIDEIEGLDAREQDEVIRFAAELAAKRRMTGSELTELAAHLPHLSGPDAEKLREEVERGFYGTASHA
jgi:hypothetical protein